MNLRNRQHLLLAVAIGAISVLVAERLILDPLIKSWKARSTRIAELRKSVAQGQVLVDRGASLRTRWQLMRTNTLPEASSAAENELLKAFDRWSQESRVGVNAIKPQWKRGSDGHDTLECRVDAFGNLAALARFLYNVESDPLAVKVDAVELTTRDDRGEQLTLGLQVSGLVLPSSRSR